MPQLLKYNILPVSHVCPIFEINASRPTFSWSTIMLNPIKRLYMVSFWKQSLYQVKCSMKEHQAHMALYESPYHHSMLYMGLCLVINWEWMKHTHNSIYVYIPLCAHLINFQFIIKYKPTYSIFSWYRLSNRTMYVWFIFILYFYLIHRLLPIYDLNLFYQIMPYLHLPDSHRRFAISMI